MDFLSKILPRTGVYVLAEFRNGLDKAPLHHFFDSVEELDAAAKQYDANNVNVFHACATYLTKENRKQANAGWMRSIWLDVDVGKANDAKSYETRKEAFSALLDMCKKLGLPPPLIVKSGKGLHVYWVLDRDLTKDEWQTIVNAFSNALNSVDFKHDPSRTKDAASVLRPVGTHWRKGDGVKSVELIHDAHEYSVDIFNAIVSQYGQAQKTKAMSMFEVNNDLGAPTEYPPSSALQIIQHCAAINEVAEAKGNVAEPLWRAMIGVVKHTTEGEAQCHEWSKGDSRYSEGETQKKIDGWVNGPTTCQHFSDLSDKCKSCKHAGKITSPIQLGYVVPEAETVTVTPIVEVEQEEPESMDLKIPKGFRFTGRGIAKLVPDEDGVLKPVEFVSQKFVITTRIRLLDGVMAARCLREVYPGVWRKFEFELSLIAQRNALRSALAAHEIFTTHPKGALMLEDYVVSYLDMLRNDKVEAVLYDSLGWKEGKSRFVIGNVALSTEGEINVEIDGNLKSYMANKETNKNMNDKSGSVEEWVKGVDYLYNVEGAEAAQYVICGAFASPLIGLMGVDGWHGIPTILAGESGRGKTKVINVACSMYGPPSTFQVAAGPSGTTENVRVTILSIMGNLPILLDEMTFVQNTELASLLYQITSGKGKGRLKPDGTFAATASLSWALKPYITVQTPLEQIMVGIKREVHNATSLRAFAFDVNSDSGWKFTDDTQAVETLVNNQYGHVGHLYLNVLLRKRNKIAEEAAKYVLKYAPQNMEEDERFLRRDIATTMFAARIAKKLGLINFNLEKLQAWAEGQVLVMRHKRGDATYSVEDYLNEYLGSLQGATLVTNRYGDARKEGEELSLVPIVKPIVARRVLDKAKPRLFVVRKHLQDWCSENGVEPGWFTGELKKKGYIMENPKTGAPTCLTGKQARLTSGTGYPSVNAYVWEFDMRKLSGAATALEPADVIDFNEAEAVKKFKQS
jgi:hypothetical protein